MCLDERKTSFRRDKIKTSLFLSIEVGLWHGMATKICEFVHFEDNEKEKVKRNAYGASM